MTASDLFDLYVKSVVISFKLCVDNTILLICKLYNHFPNVYENIVSIFTVQVSSNLSNNKTVDRINEFIIIDF